MTRRDWIEGVLLLLRGEAGELTIGEEGFFTSPMTCRYCHAENPEAHAEDCRLAGLLSMGRELLAAEERRRPDTAPPRCRICRRADGRDVRPQHPTRGVCFDCATAAEEAPGRRPRGKRVRP
ncbi:MAG: hypothetical protein L6R43_18570 [Planctomycetes bacterium]|nr:hypothetical protein [Planctomycetota bacterium]